MNTSLSRQGGRRYGQFRSSFPIAMTGFLSGFGTSATVVVVVPVVSAQPSSGAGTWQRFGEKSRREIRGEHIEPSGVPSRYRQEIDQDTPPEVIDVVNAKAQAEVLAQAVIEQRREISRIKTQMRVSTNQEALKVMETEIEKLEIDLARTKREADEMLLLTILM